jgi:DNA-binding transcriptional ArsR family regulator
VSDPKRRSILDELAKGERTVTDLCALFDVSQPAVSQHLEILRDAGLVSVRREGRFRFYRLQAEPMRAVYDYASHFERFWNARLDSLGELLDAEAKKKKS